MTHKISNWSLLLLVFACPLAAGAVAPSIVCVALGVALISFTSTVLHLRHRNTALEFSFFAWVLGGLTVFTALQLVPLPLGLVRLISPGRAAIHALLPAEGRGAFVPLSAEPPLTALRLAEIFLFFLTYVVALQHGRFHREPRRVLKAIVASGVALVVLGAIHKALGLRSYLGLVEHEAYARAFLFSSFINSNHLAGFCAFAAPLAVGLALDRIVVRPGSSRQPSPKLAIALGVSAIAIAGMGVLTISKGGVLSLAAGLGLLPALWFIATPASTVERVRGALISALVLAGGAMAIWLGWSAWTEDLRALEQGSRAQKLVVWQYAWDLVRDFPWTGAGRGAFGTVIDRYRTAPTFSYFTHPENLELQALTEWGVPVAMAAAAGVFAIMGALMRSHARARFPGAWAGGVAGLLALLLANQVDFSLEIAGVAVPAFACLGALIGSGHRHNEPQPIQLAPNTGLLVTGFVVSLAAVAAALYGGRHSIRADTRRLEHLTSNYGVEVAEINEILARHPADYLLPLIIARAELRQVPPRTDKAIEWTRRALAHQPRSFQAHLWAARSLRIQKRRDEALDEYRLALECRAPDQSALMAEIAGLSDDLISLRRAVPDTMDTLLTDFLVTRGRSDEARQVLTASISRDGNLPDLTVRMASLEEDAGNLKEAERWARESLLQETDAWAYLILARVLRRQERSAEAVPVIETGLAQYPADFALTILLANLDLELGHPESALEVIDRSLDYPRPANSERDTLLALLDRIEAAKSQVVSKERLTSLRERVQK